jgi:predicted DNA-binding protein with PD1-like motif
MMKSKVLFDNFSGEKTYALVLETGDEVVSSLLRFATENELTASHFSAIGALSEVTLGYFNLNKKDYKNIPIKEQVEVLSLVGNIAMDKGKPRIHAHIVVGKSDGTAHGGHLVEAHVRPTLEVIIDESPEYLRRRFNPEIGLALIDLDA